MLEQVDAINILAKGAQQSGALVVSEIGSQTTWLHETGDHDSYLYLSGPMGMAPSVALGVALANPDKPVLAICGDGALVMNFSAMVTAAHEAPKNLTLAVMDNGVYDFTGKVPSPSVAVDWKKLIGGLPAFTGYSELDDASAPKFSATGGLNLIYAKVKPAGRKPKAFPFTAPDIYARFCDYVENYPYHIDLVG